jgi:hypothetical protein
LEIVASMVVDDVNCQKQKYIPASWI